MFNLFPKTSHSNPVQQKQSFFKRFAALSMMILCSLSAISCGNAPKELAKETARTPQSTLLYSVMYHTILNSRDGVYIISEKQLENDFNAYKKYGFTPVFASEVIDYINFKCELPEKPLLITFDDGHYNNLYYGLPLLEKFGYKALFNIIGKFSQYSSTSGDSANPNYSHLTWTEIRKLADSGLAEIGNHTYNMHNYKPRYGVSKLSGESDDDYTKAVAKDVCGLQLKLMEECGIKPDVFAYPFGKMTELSTDILKDLGFKMLLTCCEGVNIITQNDPTTLYRVKRYNRSGRYSTEDFISKLERGAQKAQKILDEKESQSHSES